MKVVSPSAQSRLHELLSILKLDNVIKQNTGRQEWVSVLKCICMDGTSISPMIIFKGETLLSNWVPNGLLKDWIFSCNINRWTSNEHGLVWLQQVFVLRTRGKAQGRPQVLIYDGYDSHVTGRFIRSYMDNNIKLLILPLHSSHYTQLLDIGVFSPLKYYLVEELRSIFQMDIAWLFKCEWASAYAKACLNAFTTFNINGSWSVLKWKVLEDDK
jgi:DDE superfamily endonuclease